MMKTPLSPEEQERISVDDIAKLIFWLLKRGDRRTSAYEKKPPAQTANGILSNITGGTGIESLGQHPHTEMKIKNALSLLQRHGLIMDESSGTPSGYYVLTALGFESRLDENDSILIIDDAERIVQSIYKEVPYFERVVADFYRESIRAWQEGLLLSSCICLGSASERAIHQLANALAVYKPAHKNAIETKWIKKNMKDKIDTLWNWINETEQNDFPNEPCFKDLRSKLDMLAHWYRITRNEAGHADRDATLPTSKEIELSIHQFRRYVINIFQIIGLFQR